MPNKSHHEQLFDPLVECLSIITQLKQRPIASENLAAGLPLVNNQMTPQVFVKAAERVGFSAKIVQRNLNQVNKLLLPAVLLLKDNNACVLVSVKGNQYEVIFPEAGTGTTTLLKHDLMDIYSGYSIFIQKVFDFEERIGGDKLTVPKSWFWGTLWRYRIAFSQIIMAALFINIFVLATPFFIMNVYDRVVPNNAIETLWVLTIGIIIIYVFDLVLRALRGYLIEVSGKKADIVMASMTFQQVLGLRMENKPVSVGAFTNNLREFETLRDFFTSATLTTLIDMPFIVLFLLLIWYIGGAIVFIPLIAIPLVIIVSALLERPIRRAIESAYLGGAQKNAILVEAISNIETLKTIGAEGSIQSRWDRFVATTAKSGLKSRYFSMLTITLTMFIQQLNTILIVVFGVLQIQAGTMTIGALVAVTILGTRAVAPLAQLASIITRYQQSKIALKSLNTIMELPQEREQSKRFLHQPHIKGNIEIRDLSFTYPHEPHPALKSITLAIKAGEHVGILGKIGSGKTTLLRLILSLYHAQEGQITLDGVDIRQIDPADIRHNISMVPQDNILFYGTVRDNIALGRPWVQDHRVVNAAQLSGAHEFINEHPSGYDMQISERGDSLSGGQRQSISVARALLTNPSILLLDEPSSSMDNNSEEKLIQMLGSYIQNKTLILATHKVSLLKLVDRLIVLDDGKLLLDGKKEDVLNMIAKSIDNQTNEG